MFPATADRDRSGRVLSGNIGATRSSPRGRHRTRQVPVQNLPAPRHEIGSSYAARAAQGNGGAHAGKRLAFQPEAHVRRRRTGMDGGRPCPRSRVRHGEQGRHRARRKVGQSSLAARCHRMDVLERLAHGTWGLLEVKSSSGPKDDYFDDIALQASFSTPRAIVSLIEPRAGFTVPSDPGRSPS
jgi:hypothetical protein